MKTTTKVILAGLAVTIVAGSAYAAQNWHRYGPGGAQRFGKAMFEKMDVDKDGAVSSDELMQALGTRFDEADKDANATVTKAEIIAAVEANAPFERAKRHSGRIADRLVYQLDLDSNGDIARGEVENQAKKVFALFDRNDDGRVELAEIRHMAGMFRGHDKRHGGWGRTGWNGPGEGSGRMHYRWGDTDNEPDSEL
ncbi:MAG: hypothetical protein KDJ90_14570 [Nitratireductor sp.]|nr:hypothetical protein [Nitratireductor sp.]